MDRRVVVEAAVPVYDVETADEAVRIAVSKTGGMLNPDLNYVEIEMGSRTSPDGETLPPAFIAADEALVALELEMTVFNVDRDEHASRIARKEIGQRLRDIPLKVLRVEQVPEGDGDGDDSATPEREGESATTEQEGESATAEQEGDSPPTERDTENGREDGAVQSDDAESDE